MIFPKVFHGRIQIWTYDDHRKNLGDINFDDIVSIFKVTCILHLCPWYCQHISPMAYKRFFYGWLSNLDIWWPWTESRDISTFGDRCSIFKDTAGFNMKILHLTSCVPLYCQTYFYEWLSNLDIWSITWNPEIAWPPRDPINIKIVASTPGYPRDPINIKIVASTPGYPVELHHHNALTFSQHAALGYPDMLISAEDHHQPRYANNE